MVYKKLIISRAIFLSFLTSAAMAADVGRGEELYELCAQCHGETGAGNQAFEAPSIAGLDQWYLEAQLEKFQLGLRGAHPEDLPGMRMRPMATTLIHEGDVADVAAFVASLPPASPEAVNVGGNASKGRILYMICMSCHGPQGAGDLKQHAPPLARANDWYLLAQLRKFKAGIRGSDPRDASGLLMQPQAKNLPNEQAMKDVIAYIMTMPKQ